MNLIIAGSRTLTGDREATAAIARAIGYARQRNAAVYTGDATGADTLAAQLAGREDVPVEQFCAGSVADFVERTVTPHGWSGGREGTWAERLRLRTQRTVLAALSDGCIGCFVFFDGNVTNGSRLTVNLCKHYGIPVVVWGVPFGIALQELGEGIEGHWAPVKSWEGCFRWVQEYQEPLEDERLPAHYDESDDRLLAMGGAR
jgi:hypothetical protein